MQGLNQRISSTLTHMPHLLHWVKKKLSFLGCAEVARLIDFLSPQSSLVVLLSNVWRSGDVKADVIASVLESSCFRLYVLKKKRKLFMYSCEDRWLLLCEFYEGKEKFIDYYSHPEVGWLRRMACFLHSCYHLWAQSTRLVYLVCHRCLPSQRNLQLLVPGLYLFLFHPECAANSQL